MSGALSLVVMAFAGTLLLIAIAYALGFSKAPVIESEAVAMALVTSATSIAATSALLASDQSGALVRNELGCLFLAVMRGDCPVVRHVKPENLSTPEGGRVHIDFQDIGFPPFDFVTDPSRLMPFIGPKTQDSAT
jgi:hypothetical protein